MGTVAQVALRYGMDAGQTACDATHVLVRRTEPGVPLVLLVPFRPRGRSPRTRIIQQHILYRRIRRELEDPRAMFPVLTS